ncbi:GGDEF domain-containing protein [Oxalobacteraceae bacterium GrIS 1.11]
MRSGVSLRLSASWPCSPSCARYLHQQDLAVRDPLTGLTNRLGLQELLAVELEKARRYRHPFILRYLALDFADTLMYQVKRGGKNGIRLACHPAE